MLAENGKPIIARLHRCIDGKHGQALSAAQKQLRDRLTAQRGHQISPEARTTAALVEAQRRGLSAEREQTDQ